MIELMITIVILCVLLGLAIPAFSSWIPNYRLRGAARDIYSNFQFAKMTAVKDQSRMRSLVRRGQQPVSSGQLGPNRSLKVLPEALVGMMSVLQTVNFSEYGSGVAIRARFSNSRRRTPSFDNNVTFEEDGIVFDSRGMVFRPSGAASAGGYVYLQNNRNNTYAVRCLELRRDGHEKMDRHDLAAVREGSEKCRKAETVMDSGFTAVQIHGGFTRLRRCQGRVSPSLSSWWPLRWAWSSSPVFSGPSKSSMTPM